MFPSPSPSHSDSLSYLLGFGRPLFQYLFLWAPLLMLIEMAYLSNSRLFLAISYKVRSLSDGQTDRISLSFANPEAFAFPLPIGGAKNGRLYFFISSVLRKEKRERPNEQ